MTWMRASAARVRAAIASAWLGAHGRPTLGTIVLRPHQRAAAARLRAMLDAHGGALLADPVGLGKTYSALAAVHDAERLLIVAPAALRAMWTGACAAAGVDGRFLSYQALSLGHVAAPAPDVVIADESHHLRNPTTRRYAALARLSANARLVLVSATPIHNRLDDLRAQLALVLGQRAWTMRERDLPRHVVKRDAAAVDDRGQPPSLPRVEDVRWVEIADDAGLLAAIVDLPAPVSAEDAGDGGALIALSLIRQWGSSRAALDAALRARLAQVEALRQAFAAGRHPTRAQLRAWCYADGALQLAFPQLATDNVAPDPQSLMQGADHHIQAVRALRRRLASGANPDDARAAALRRIRRAHPGARMVVFAEFSATVRALYTRLAPSGGVAMLTHGGGLVAGGRITRRELLQQFAPRVGAVTPRAQEVTMLITTDLLSEGVNLQEASVVVHADLPWSPARCEQRVGRVRRLTSPHDRVFVYAFRPPAPADELLHLERRLRHKIALAARAVGIRGTIMPRLFPTPVVDAPPSLQADAALTARLESWLNGGRRDGAVVPVVAAMFARTPGFLAVVRHDAHTGIVAADGSMVGDSAETVLAAVESATDEETPVDASALDDALARLHEWCDERASLDLLDLPVSAPGVARRRLLRRIDTIASRSPRHLRGRYVSLARQARRAATLTFGAGAEQVLEELAEARMPDDAWLNAVRTFAQLHTRREAADTVDVLALLLLVPTSLPAAAPPP